MEALPVILIVDDDTDALTLGRKMLEEFDCRIYSAENGEDALSIIMKLDRLDVIVSDLNMPGMDSATLLKRVRESFPDSMRILYSGRIELDFVFPLMRDNVISRAIQKPMMPEKARRLVESLLQEIINCQGQQRANRYDSTKLDGEQGV